MLRGGVINVKVPDMAEIENICDRPAGSAALVFSLPRYPRAAQEITELLHSRGIKIIGISDALNSPIADRCDILFVVPQCYVLFLRSVPVLRLKVYLANTTAAPQADLRLHRIPYDKVHIILLTKARNTRILG